MVLAEECRRLNSTRLNVFDHITDNNSRAIYPGITGICIKLCSSYFSNTNCQLEVTDHLKGFDSFAV